jgi:excisionase family DNA binding protein
VPWRPKLTVTEAAIELGIDYDFTLRLLRVGKLKGKKVGNKWVVDAASVKRRAARIKEVA